MQSTGKISMALLNQGKQVGEELNMQSDYMLEA